MVRPSLAWASSPSADRGWRRATILLAATALGRVPVTVFPVLFILQSRIELGRFDVGGFAVLAYSLGATVNGLLSGWLFSMLGHRIVATVSGLLTTAALLVSAAVTHEAPAYLALAVVLGLCFPPLHVGSRAIYPRLLDDRRLLRVYSADVSVIQVTWIVAPVLVVAAAGIVGIAVVYLLLAALTVAGVTCYLVLAHGMAAGRTPAGLTRRGIWMLLCDGRMHVYLLVAGGLMASSGLILPLLIAIMPSSGAQSTAILVWSIGSAVGSLVVNRREVRRPRLVVGLSVAAAAIAVGAWLGAAPAIDIALFSLGFATAPVAAAVFYFTSQHFRSRHQVLVFGVITSVQLVSQGVGTSVSGLMIDAGAGAWVWVTVVAILLAVVITVGANARSAFTHAPVLRTDAITIIPDLPDPRPEKP